MMKNALISAITGMILVTVMATTALAAAKTNRVKVRYVPPENPEFQEIYTELKQRGALEKLQKLLSPIRLPRTLRISLTECDGEADAMYADDEIEICYEYIEELQKYMATEATPAGIEPLDTLIGPFVDTVLHEFAHALFDYHDVPVLGREEDAADQVSAYIYLQLGKDEARRLIMGTVYAYMLEVQDTDPPDMEEYADEHSTTEQRTINLICMAYGSDPELFKDLPKLGGIPQYRIDICEEEYELISFAYQKLIGPLVDQKLAKKVFAKSWLPDRNSQILTNPP
jgi:hypothetical protein